MVIQLQTSFTPKKAPAPLQPASSAFHFGRSVNLFAVIGVIIFLLTAALAGGVFLYRGYLIKDIAKKDAALAEARKSFAPEFVDEAARLSKRIEAIKSLLSSHRTLTPLFDVLEKKTLETVRFQDFSLDTKGSEPSLTMTGQARSFNAVALQSDIFGGDRYFKNPIFSNFTLSDRGDVLFNFRTSLDQKLLLYRETIVSEAEDDESAQYKID